MSVKIEWHPEGYLRELHATLGNMLEESAEVVEMSAKNECPVITGTLQDSITHVTDRQDLVAKVGSNVEYAYFVEMGTRRFSPRAYLRKGLYNSIGLIRSIFSSK